MKSFLDRWIGEFCLALLALVCASIAQAQAPGWNENRMAWEPATACSNPSEPLARCPTSSYTVEHSRGAAGPWAAIASVPSTQLTYTHSAAAGENCYRFRGVNTIAGPSIPSSPLLCRTNVEPPPPQIPPGPPTNPRFVTISATAHPQTDWTPVFRISGDPPRAGTMFGLVPTGRATQSGPLFSYRGKPYCRVEVGSKELSGTTDARNLAAPCGPS
jgi:hypothetical protein